MRVTCLALGTAAVLLAQKVPTAAGPSPDLVWKDLQDGNQRFVSGTLKHPHQTTARKLELATAQHPVAIVLSCADSRVPPEVIFDQGLGDLFTVRVAGNVAPDDVVASLEYAVAHLGPKLIVVLGHERCGAVETTMKGGKPEGHMAALVDRIKPAVESSRTRPGDSLDNAIRANVHHVVEQLKGTGPILAENIKSGKVKIVGARYDLDSGTVDVVP